MATGGGKGRIPWTKLQHAQSDYILDEYLPSGITLTQYHHIRVSDANALLQHWTARQAAGEIPFRFEKAVGTSRQGDRVSVSGDSPDNVEDARGEDLDSVGTRNGPSQGGDGEFQGDGEEPEDRPAAESGQSQVRFPDDGGH